MWHLERLKYVQRVISNLLLKSISFCALSLVDCQGNLMFFSFLYDLFLKRIDVFLNDFMIQVNSDMNIAHTYVACFFFMIHESWRSWELCLWVILHYLFFILFCMIVQWSLFVQWFSDFQTASCHMDNADAHTTSSDVGTGRWDNAGAGIWTWVYDKVGQGFCGARNGWLRISATMCSMQRVFFSPPQFCIPLLTGPTDSPIFPKESRMIRT